MVYWQWHVIYFLKKLGRWVFQTFCFLGYPRIPNSNWKNSSRNEIPVWLKQEEIENEIPINHIETRMKMKFLNRKLELPIFRVCVWWKALKKSFKICHIFRIRKPNMYQRWNQNTSDFYQELLGWKLKAGVHNNLVHT